MNPEKHSEFRGMGDLILGYIKYWKWFALSTGLFVVLSVIYVYTVNPIYHIAGTAMISDDKSSSLSASVTKSMGLGGLLGGSSNLIEDESRIMSSYSTMKNMAYDLELYKNYTLKNFPFNKPLYNNSPVVVDLEKSVIDTLSVGLSMEIKQKSDESLDISIKIGKEKKNDYKLDKLPAVLETSIGRVSFRKGLPNNEKSYNLSLTVTPLNLAAELLQKKIIIEPASRKSDIIELGIDDVIPQRGLDILNYLMNYYNEDALNDKHEMARNTIEFVDERIANIGIEVDSLEKDIELFKIKNNITDVTAEAKAFIEQYQTMKERAIYFDVQLNVISLLKNYLNDPQNKYAMIPVGLSISGGAADGIKAYNEMILERSRLLKSSSETNPAITLLDDRLASMRENVLLSIDNMQRDAEIQKQHWKSFEGGVENKMLQMPTQEREFVDIQRQRMVKSELYVFLLSKREETQLILAMKTPKAKIIDHAYCLTAPIFPKKKIIVGIAFILGLVLPFVILYVQKMLKFKVSTKDELAALVDAPVLGEICYNKDNSKIVVKPNVNSSIAELFRLVRTNTQFLLKQDKKVILVTSSISGEGKTFFALNLALSFSLMKNKKVVLVGLDIRSPKLTEYLSVNSKSGMTMFLASDSMAPEEIIIHRPDIHNNFYIVPAGPLPPNPSELLLSDRLDELFSYLRNNFDYIIVDTAPIGMVSDTFSLDRISDMTLYVFRANYTNKSYLRLVESVIEQNKLKDVSMVINGTTSKSAYGYGYGQEG